MLDFINKIENIYNIIVPIGAVVLGWLLNFLSVYINSEKQWKLIREKSSSDKYFNYFMCMFFLGFFGAIIYVFIIFILELWFYVNVSTGTIKWTYLIYSILFHLFFFCVAKPKEGLISFKKNYRYEKQWKIAIYRMPIIFSCAVWSFAFCNNVSNIVKVLTAFVIIFEIICYMVLNREMRFEYKYVKFYLPNGKEIDNICVEDVRQKKNWIIATDKKECKEYRFRVKDLERAEYSK